MEARGEAARAKGYREITRRAIAHAAFPFDRVISVAGAGSFRPHVAN
jgi:hypothetical protein